jgi:hypothetical protein
MQRLDGVEAGVKEARDARLLTGLGRPNGIPGYADDAVALAQQVERLRRFLGEADDAAGVLIRQNASG